MVVAAVGTVMTPAFAGGAKSDRVIIKSSHVQKSKRVRPAVKDTASLTDYYTRARIDDQDVEIILSLRRTSASVRRNASYIR